MPIQAVLADLVAQAPDAIRGAVFCDYEGERVDSVINDPTLDAFELDLTGASYATLLDQLRITEDAQLRVVHPSDVTWVQVVAEGYYVVLLTRRNGLDTTLAAPLRQVGYALRELL